MQSPMYLYYRRKSISLIYGTIMERVGPHRQSYATDALPSTAILPAPADALCKAYVFLD